VGCINTGMYPVGSYRLICRLYVAHSTLGDPNRCIPVEHAYVRVHMVRCVSVAIIVACEMRFAELTHAYTNVLRTPTAPHVFLLLTYVPICNPASLTCLRPVCISVAPKALLLRL
jgi:hypothetical protein